MGAGIPQTKSGDYDSSNTCNTKEPAAAHGYPASRSRPYRLPAFIAFVGGRPVKLLHTFGKKAYIAAVIILAF
tara:strand:- start:77 stop:295 length:219 start_codon:yes stop_codon:yes gene_type:complete